MTPSDFREVESMNRQSRPMDEEMFSFLMISDRTAIALFILIWALGTIAIAQL